MQKTSKYYKLWTYFSKSKKKNIELSLAELQEINCLPLPKSSEIRTWWSNTPENGHLQAHAWVDAGYFVSTKNGKYIFKK